MSSNTPLPYFVHSLLLLRSATHRSANLFVGYTLYFRFFTGFPNRHLAAIIRQKSRILSSLVVGIQTFHFPKTPSPLCRSLANGKTKSNIIPVAKSRARNVFSSNCSYLYLDTWIWLERKTHGNGRDTAH